MTASLPCPTLSRQSETLNCSWPPNFLFSSHEPESRTFVPTFVCMPSPSATKRDSPNPSAPRESMQASCGISVLVVPISQIEKKSLSKRTFRTVHGISNACPCIQSHPLPKCLFSEKEKQNKSFLTCVYYTIYSATMQPPLGVDYFKFGVDSDAQRKSPHQAPPLTEWT